MIKFRMFNDSSVEKKSINLVCRDNDDNLENLLNYIKEIGNVGHSFKIIVDPDSSDTRKEFYWDGDGSDKIFELSVSEESKSSSSYTTPSSTSYVSSTTSTSSVEKNFSAVPPKKSGKARIEWAKKNGVIYKGPDGWHIISLRTGKDWSAIYKTKEKAEAGLRAYQANKR